LLSFGDVKRGIGRLLVVGSLGADASALERRRRELAQIIALIDEGVWKRRPARNRHPSRPKGIVSGFTPTFTGGGTNLILPEAPRSIFAASASLCKGALHMSTAITAQNGARVKRAVTVAVAGCKKPKRRKQKSHTTRR